MDIIKVDVPLFLRLLELAREDVKDDADLHDITQKVIELSQSSPATMADYEEIVSFMKKQGSKTDELETIKKLSGLENGQANY
jgi:hypothetical protein